MGYGVKGISSTKFLDIVTHGDAMEVLRNVYRNGGRPAYAFIVGEDGVAVDFNPNEVDKIAF